MWLVEVWLMWGLVRLDVVVQTRWAVEVEGAVEVVVHRTEVGVEGVRVGIGAVARTAC